MTPRAALAGSAARYPTSYVAALGLAVAVWAPVPLPGLPLTLVQAAAVAVIVTFALESALRYRAVDLAALRAARGTAFPLAIGIVWVVVAAILAAATAADRAAAATFALRYLVGLALIVALAGTLRFGRRWRVVAATTVATGATIVTLAWLGTRFPELGAVTLGVGRRSKALFEHPNQLGMVASAVAPVAAGLMLAARPARALLPAAATGMLLFGVFLSGSIVNAAVAALALVALVVLAQVREPATAGRAAGLVLLVSTAVAAVAFAPALLASISPRIAGGLETLLRAPADILERIPSVASRLAIYRRAADVIAERPLLGIGGDNAYTVLTTAWASNIPHAHNLFLDVALGTGLVGLAGMLVLAAAWLAVALRLVAHGLRSAGPDGTILVGLGLGLIAFLLTNQSSDSLGGTIIYLLWLWLGVGLASGAAGHAKVARRAPTSELRPGTRRAA